MSKYFKIWFTSMLHQAQTAFASRLGVVVFLVGKLLRFYFFLLFLFLIVHQTKSIAGYSLWEVIFFYATFNLIDSFPQMVLRSVYGFRNYVVSGFFDFYMVQPVSPLFRSLFGGSDILDIPMLFLSIGYIIYSSFMLPHFSITGVFLYILLILNAFIISLAFHILVLSIGVISTEVDNTVMLYRDLTQMGRLPIDIYKQAVSFILTFVIPVGVMITFPVKALLGALSLQFIGYSVVFSVVFLTLSLFLWTKSLKNYTSASS
ncbi:MAG: ABC transporter permease [Candidatus Levyibacteriota bacterium]